MDEGETVSRDYSEEELLLKKQVEESEEALQALESELMGADAELDQLAQKNQEFEILEQACRSLEELETMGAGHLFWGDRDVEPTAALGSARRKIEEYGESIIRVEERRQAILEKIDDRNTSLDYLHYDLAAAMEREENRKNEWLIERDVDELPPHVQVMPWARGYEEDQRFKKSLGVSVLTSVVLALLVSSIALPIVERNAVIEVPERVAKLVREELPPPPPPAPVEEPAVAAAEPDTREQVKSKGILAFRDSFASSAMLKPSANLGSQARVRSAGDDAVGRPQRSMVTTMAPGSSGGINLASISRDVGGGGGQGMGGVQVSRVASSIGGCGTADRPRSGGASAGRTDEEIQIVFDRYKAALYRLYNRELRKDPTLRGQMVLRLTIEPDGSVSFCVLQSSDMNAPVLAEQVVDRVSTFDFGAKDGIVAMTIIYPIDFLPAA